MIRSSIVSGHFYESDFGKLEQQLKDCFLSKLGPGDLPIKKRAKKVYGIISPHAGYSFSGPCSAWAFKEIAESQISEVYVILGTNHTGTIGNSSYIEADWETPLGLIKTYKDFKNKLISEHKEAHLKEHSIEVQLPFLQFVNRDNLKDLKILPIIISEYDYDSCKELAKELAKIPNPCIIASSDFTHHGKNYNYTPFKYQIPQELQKMDEEAIEFIKKLDTEGFLAYTKGKTICGAGPIAVTMETVKLLGAKKARLLHYYNSGDVTEDYTNVVGYAAIVFE